MKSVFDAFRFLDLGDEEEIYQISKGPCPNLDEPPGYERETLLGSSYSPIGEDPFTDVYEAITTSYQSVIEREEDDEDFSL